MRQFWRLLAAGGLALLLAGCSKPTPPAPVARPPVVWTDELRDSVRDYGLRVEKAIAEQDTVFMKRLFNFDSVLDGLAHERKLPREFLQGMRTGMQKGQDSASQALMEARVYFVAVREADGRPSVLFRIHAGPGMEYAEYQLEKNETLNDWQVVESYTFALGMRLTDLFQAMLVPMTKELDQTLLEKLSRKKPDGDFVNGIPQVQKVITLAREGKAAEAMLAWEALPAPVKRQKFAMVAHMMAASRLPDANQPDSAYVKSLNDLQAAFPDDPAMLLHAIDHRTLTGDLAGAHQAIDDLKAQVSNDPYLDFFHGYLYLRENNIPKALECARTWQQLKPDHSDGWELQLDCAVQANDFNMVAKTLSTMKNQFGFALNDLRTIPTLAPFLASPEGRAWAAANP